MPRSPRLCSVEEVEWEGDLQLAEEPNPLMDSWWGASIPSTAHDFRFKLRNIRLKSRPHLLSCFAIGDFFLCSRTCDHEGFVEI